MKLQIMSDLHIAMWGQRLGRNWFYQEFVEQTQTDADVLILAGDCVDLRRSDRAWSRARLTEFCARYKKVLFVAGNHEFYGTSIVSGRMELKRLEKEVPGLTVLDHGDMVVIDGQRFLGATMWQPGSTDAFRISDHSCIADMDVEAPFQFRKWEEFITKILSPGDIVVTHHAPSNQSLSDEWRGDPSNRWFITQEMEPLILERQPLLWVHGHTHTPFDYHLGKTRVICNPAGYPDEGVKFNPKLVIEV